MLFANNMVACTPPVVAGVKVKTERGFAVGSNQLTLCELKVVFDSKHQDSVLYKESSVFVSLESASGDGWAKRVFTYEGVQFVLVPAGFVIAYTSRFPGEENGKPPYTLAP